MRIYFACGLTALLCIGSLKKRSLSESGAAAAAFVGLATASNDNLLFTAVLLAFFISSSFWTKYGAAAKLKVDPTHGKESERDWRQVLCNGGIGSVISLIYQYNFDGRNPAQFTADERRLMMVLVWGYIGFYACCAADTWASELGTLSSNWPILITTWRPVPPGTNGGVSKLGMLSSFAGGAAIGLTADVVMFIQYFPAYRSGAIPKIPYNMVGSILGTVGSLVDSLLGATLQPSYLIDKRVVVSDLHSSRTKDSSDVKLICGKNILSNNMVNVVASASTAALAAIIAGMLF